MQVLATAGPVVTVNVEIMRSRAIVVMESETFAVNLPAMTNSDVERKITRVLGQMKHE